MPRSLPKSSIPQNLTHGSLLPLKPSRKSAANLSVIRNPCRAQPTSQPSAQLPTRTTMQSSLPKNSTTLSSSHPTVLTPVNFGKLSTASFTDPPHPPYQTSRQSHPLPNSLPPSSLTRSPTCDQAYPQPISPLTCQSPLAPLHPSPCSALPTSTK